MVVAYAEADVHVAEALPAGPSEPVVDTRVSNSSEDGKNKKKKPKRVRVMSRVVCANCQTEVGKKNLHAHKASSRCRVRSLELQMARKSVQAEVSRFREEESSLPVANDPLPAPVAQQSPSPSPPSPPQFEARPQRAKMDLPMAADNDVFQNLRTWLLNVASMAASTSSDAVSSLRKLMGAKYGADRVITAQELSFGLVDTQNFARFMTTLETGGMKAASRKRYTDSVRQGLLWLDTQPRTPESPMPTVEAIQAMRATLAVNKKGLARKARTQKHHLSYDSLVASGQMLLETELPDLLKSTAREFVDLVKQCHADKLTTPADAVRALKLLVTVMAVGTGVAVRGGDFGQLTVEHVREAQQHHVMTVPNHKTSATNGPLVIPVPPWLQWMLHRWVNLFRPLLVSQNAQYASNKLFLSPRGRAIVNFAQVVLTPYIKERTGKHITFTTIRKFFETVSFNSFDAATQKLISQGQCHSDATASAYYQLRQQQKAAHASHQAFDQHMGLSDAVSPVIASVVDVATTTDDARSCSSLESLELEVPPSSPAPCDIDWDLLPDPPELPELSVVAPCPETKTPLPLPSKPCEWSDEELNALVNAVAEWEKSSEGRGFVQWREVRAIARPHLQNRAPMNLKDKMRTLSGNWLAKLDAVRATKQVPTALRRVYKRSAIKGRKAVHTLVTPDAKRARVAE